MSSANDRDRQGSRSSRRHRVSTVSRKDSLARRKNDGPAGGDIDSRRSGRSGQPLGSRPQPGHAVADRQSKGRGAGGPSRRPATGPLHPRLSLTPAGEQYVAACRRILDQLQEADRAASGEYLVPLGELVVAARWRSAAACAARSRHVPGRSLTRSRVRLVLSDRNAELIEDHVDVAVRIGALPDSSLSATRAGAVRNLVCASPGFVARYGMPHEPDDLAKLDCVTFEARPGAWRFGTREIPVRARLAVTTAEAAVDAAVAGVGVTRVLSYQADAALAAGRLVAMLEAFEPDPLPVTCCMRARGRCRSRPANFWTRRCPGCAASWASAAPGPRRPAPCRRPRHTAPDSRRLHDRAADQGAQHRPCRRAGVEQAEALAALAGMQPHRQCVLLTLSNGHSTCVAANSASSGPDREPRPAACGHQHQRRPAAQQAEPQRSRRPAACVEPGRQPIHQQAAAYPRGVGGRGQDGRDVEALDHGDREQHRDRVGGGVGEQPDPQEPPERAAQSGPGRA